MIGVEFNGDDIILDRIGVDVFDIYINGVDNNLFFNDNGPCIFVTLVVNMIKQRRFL